MADISHYEESCCCFVETGVDFVGTTLSGYTSYSPKVVDRHWAYPVAWYLNKTDVIAEGMIRIQVKLSRYMIWGGRGIVVGRPLLA